MKIFHRRLDTDVTHQLLDCNNIQTVFQKMGGESVPKGVRVNIFEDTRLFGCLLDYPLYAAFGIAVIQRPPAGTQRVNWLRPKAVS